jgi:hypothetical protein
MSFQLMGRPWFEASPGKKLERSYLKENKSDLVKVHYMHMVNTTIKSLYAIKLC